MRVYEFMAENARRIIESIASEKFSSRDFIWKLMSDYAVRLEIQVSGTKESSVDPFGNISATEVWLKNTKK